MVRDGSSWIKLYTADEKALDEETGSDETCSTLPTGELEAYQHRGWCRLEVLAALCPKRTLTGRWRSGPVNMRFRYHHDPDNAGIGPQLTSDHLHNPLAGGFTHQRDNDHVERMVNLISKRFAEYTVSGSTAWDETLDPTRLPTWLVEIALDNTNTVKPGRTAKYNVADEPRGSAKTKVAPKAAEDEFSNLADP